MPVLLMKSLTCTPGDMPKSTSLNPEASAVRPGAARQLWKTPVCSIRFASYGMTRANDVEMLPPSPKNACLKSPEFRAEVPPPRPTDANLLQAHAQADRHTLLVSPQLSSRRRVA